MTKKKMVRFQTSDAEEKLMTFFPPERASNILILMNPGEQRILADCWYQLQQDLLQHPDPKSMSIPRFMFHFHNYAS